MTKAKCTYCAIQEIRDSLEPHEMLTFRKSNCRDVSCQGIDVYKHPKLIRQPWDPAPGRSWFITWIDEYPHRCECP